MKKVICVLCFSLCVISFCICSFAKENPITYSTVFESMTEEEYDELLKTLYLECCDEPFEGQVAVVEVIFNRVISQTYPDSVHDVIFQRGQFSTAKHLYKINEGLPYKPYGDSAVDLSQLRTAVEYVRLHGYSVLPMYAEDYGYIIPENKDYVFFATYKANGTNFIKIKGHYFGMGMVE